MAKGRERTAKWYFKNEKEVMKELGLNPVEGSGSKWVSKEDGENEFVLAQLKSTDKESYKINLLDLEKLEYHANVSHKCPLFVLQFLQNDTRYALAQIEDIPILAEYITTGKMKPSSDEELDALMQEVKALPIPKKKKIKSSQKARKQFFKQKEQEREERKWKK